MNMVEERLVFPESNTLRQDVRPVLKTRARDHYWWDKDRCHERDVKCREHRKSCIDTDTLPRSQAFSQRSISRQRQTHLLELLKSPSYQLKQSMFEHKLKDIRSSFCSLLLCRQTPRSQRRTCRNPDRATATGTNDCTL